MTDEGPSMSTDKPATSGIYPSGLWAAVNGMANDLVAMAPPGQ